MEFFLRELTAVRLGRDAKLLPRLVKLDVEVENHDT
jgi:hypothetical protein